MFALEENHSSKHRPLRVAVAVWSAVALAGVAAVALRHGPSPTPEVLVPQATTTIHCGDVISTSIVVANSLNCTGPGTTTNGLVVGHASITINLNGNTLYGTSSFTGVTSSFASVTITNGTLSGWQVGVRVDGLADKVTAVRATATNYGIFLAGTDSSATGNVVFKNGSGIALIGHNERATSNVVRENTVSGILISGATNDFVQTNQSENNGGSGIQDSGSAFSTISGNITNGNGSDGIYSVAGGANTVASNTANYNGAYGIEAAPGGKDGGGNLAKGNTTAAQCKDVVCS